MNDVSATHPTVKEQADYYDLLWDETSRRPMRHQHLLNRMHAIDRHLKALKLRKAALLDAGCGIGDITNLLARYGTVHGVDLSPNAIRIAKTRFPTLSFQSANILELDVPNNSFDVVVCSELIEHLPRVKQEELLREFHRLLRPNGYVILTTPNGRISCKLRNEQPIEQHLTTIELANLMSPWFNCLRMETVHAFFPLRCNSSRPFQLLRLAVFSMPFARSVLEYPAFTRDRGLYLVCLGQKQSS